MSKLKHGFVANMRYLSLAGIVGLGMLTIIATGGGGDGGGSGGIVYTGLTSQATVDDTNFEILATESYLGGHVGSAMGGLGAVVQASQIGRPRTLNVSQALEKAIRRIDISSPLTGASFGAVFRETDTLFGSCGGTATYTISVDDVTWNFSGQIIFSGFCEEGVTLSGSSLFSGLIDPGIPAPVQFTISFTFLSVTTGAGDGFATSGRISYNYQQFPAAVNIEEALLRDNSTMEVFWINNYNMTLEEVVGPPAYVEFTMSGRFYDPEYGWVAVSTDPATPFQIFDGDIWPSQGVLMIEGLPDLFPPSPTGARLTASPPPPDWGYVVDLENGNDDPPAYDDWTSGFQPWG